MNSPQSAKVQSSKFNYNASLNVQIQSLSWDPLLNKACLGLCMNASVVQMNQMGVLLLRSAL